MEPYDNWRPEAGCFQEEGKGPGGCSERPGPALSELRLHRKKTAPPEDSGKMVSLGRARWGVLTGRKKGIFRDEVRKQRFCQVLEGPSVGFGDFRGMAMRPQKHVEAVKEDPGGLAFLQ